MIMAMTRLYNIKHDSFVRKMILSSPTVTSSLLGGFILLVTTAGTSGDGRRLTTTDALLLTPSIRSCQKKKQKHPISFTTTTTTSSILNNQRQYSTSSLLTVNQLDNDIESITDVRTTIEERQMTMDALGIIQDAIKAVNPYTAIQSCLKRENDNVLKISTDSSSSTSSSFSLDLTTYDKIVVIAFGKASSAMATAVVQQVYGGQNDSKKNNDPTSSPDTTQQQQQQRPLDSTMRLPCSGVVICKDGHATADELDVLARYRVEVLEASHPVPDIRSVHAADRLLEAVASASSSRTLVLCCISGGGSALFCRPTPPLTLQDLQRVNTCLLECGMGIQEMNVIRKRLEVGKGGRLAAKCYPSHVVTLVLSDVLGDPLDLIASGPTVCDTSTWADAWKIIDRYKLQERFPSAVMDIIQQGRDGLLEDSPSSDHPVFDTSRTVLVGNNQVAVNAAARTAETLGYIPVILGTEIEGEAKEIAHMYTAMAKYLQQSYSSHYDQQHKQQQQTLPSYSLVKSLPTALIAGGETTVSLTPNSGKGGRNQELALSAAIQLHTMNVRNVVLVSVGTDGGDGPTDAAGAIVDGTTVQTTLSQALEALSTHNAYPYLDTLCMGGVEEMDRPLIKTGPTGTNVADICVTLIQPAPSPDRK